MDNIEIGNHVVPTEFINLPFFSLASLSRTEIDSKILELRCNCMMKSSNLSSSGLFCISKIMLDLEVVGLRRWNRSVLESRPNRRRSLRNGIQ
ncbi:unnamed protein product [Linum trigynum]|uniref:Uncharacterized protein n=1 Tax=Linum trigynum TaxID=586398 RepID=A0AAV2D559_9ROSI